VRLSGRGDMNNLPHMQQVSSWRRVFGPRVRFALPISVLSPGGTARIIAIAVIRVKLPGKKKQHGSMPAFIRAVVDHSTYNRPLTERVPVC
jgi:hypothetical protein